MTSGKKTDEEWPQKGRQRRKKQNSYFAFFFAPFEPFCGPMPFLQ
jgi:hypothetical protein